MCPTVAKRRRLGQPSTGRQRASRDPMRFAKELPAAIPILRLCWTESVFEFIDENGRGSG